MDDPDPRSAAPPLSRTSLKQKALPRERRCRRRRLFRWAFSVPFEGRPCGPRLKEINGLGGDPARRQGGDFASPVSEMGQGTFGPVLARSSPKELNCDWEQGHLGISSDSG